jgi:hypothetical protein
VGTLAQLCGLAESRPALEGPLLAWLCAQDDVAGLLELVAATASADVLRAAPCGDAPHGYRAVASLLHLPGKPPPRLRELWSDRDDGEVRGLLLALAIFGRPPRAWHTDEGAGARAARLAARMAEMLGPDAAAARRERRPRAATALLLGAHLDAAASCHGCAALLSSAISDGGRDRDAWILFLDRFGPESSAWWSRALGTWTGELAADLREVIADGALQPGLSALDPSLVARGDGHAAALVESIYRIGADPGADSTVGRAREHALWIHVPRKRATKKGEARS